MVPPGMGLTAVPTIHDDGYYGDEGEVIDLPAPKIKVPREELPDLPTPVGPRPRNREMPDLLAPVGPKPTKGVSDLLAPVGPRPTKGVSDLLAPVAPRIQPPPTVPPSSNRSTTDLLMPVGPTSLRNIPDLLQPVGPTSVRNAPDLMTPVGPNPIRNVPDLMTPVGPLPIKNAPELITPVGPKPTKGIDLPAPKGFFDEDPPPSPAHPSFDGLEGDDDLDVVPAGEFHPQIEPGFRDHSRADQMPGPASGFGMDDLDLGGESPPPAQAQGDDDQSGYGEVDLPRQPPDEGLVSFSAPTGRTSVGARPVGVGVDLVEAPKRKPGTMAGDVPAEAKASASAERGPLRLPKALLITLAVLALLGGGAYYVYTSIELTIFGFPTVPARERQAQIARGLTDARKLLASNDAGHWAKAAQAAERVVTLDKTATDAKALAAQAYAAQALEEGRNFKADKDKADALVGEVLKSGGRGREVEKAVALRSILDPGKAAEAVNALAAAARGAPSDPDAPLFAGWAALEARAYDKAKPQFEAALKLVPDRQPALVGLGRAELGLGDNAKATEAFQRVFDKYPDRKNYGAWLALTELRTKPHDGTGQRERELAVLCESAPERETAHPRDRARALTLYGDEAMAAGRWAQAAERYRLALVQDPRNNDALVGGALAVVEQRSHSEGNASLVDARKALEAALVQDPRHVGALLGLMRIALLEGRAADALKVAEAALVAGDKSAEVHYWHGKILEEQAVSDPDGAEKAYRRAMELAPGNYNAYVALSQLYLGRARTTDKLGKKAEAKAWTDKAVAVLAPIADAAKTDKQMAIILGGAYFGAKDMVHAEQWFRVALAIDGGFVDAHADLAAALEAELKQPEATVEWAKAHSLAPKREDVALSLARAYEKERNYDAAERVYKGLLSTDSGNMPTTRALAAAGLYAARRGQIDVARKYGDQVGAVDPGNPAAMFLQGLGAYTDDKMPEAEKLFHDAIALDPQAQYWEVLGRLHELKRHSLGEAQTAYEQALKLDPTYVPVLVDLGGLHIKRMKWDQAVVPLEQATRIDPTVKEAWIGLGRSYAKLPNRRPDAVAAYEQSLRLDDKDATTYYELGAIFYDDDRPGAQTIVKLREAIAHVQPGTKPEWLPEAYRKLGFSYRAASNRAEMCKTFKVYLEIAPRTDIMRNEVAHTRAVCPD